jgi:hypothetical protein
MTEDSTPLPVGSAAAADHGLPEHLRKEGWTMALYVAVCLIAALAALANVTAVPGHILGLVWGTTVGLAVAHVFAFRIAGRLVHDGVLPMADRVVSVVQLAGAAAVAVLVTVPVLLVPPAYELAWAGYTCAAIIGVVGYFVARGAAHGRIRAVLFGLAVLVATFAVAALKACVGGSLTGARILSLSRHLHADNLRDGDSDVVGPASGYRCLPQLENRRHTPVLL